MFSGAKPPAVSSSQPRSDSRDTIMQAIVLAGGLGTRLRPAVPDLPKALAPVAGRPFLEYVLEYLKMQGIRRVVLAVSYGRELIQTHFGRRWRSLDLCYSTEERPLGTGGAIMQALTLTEGAPVVVLNGDTMFPINLAEMRALHITGASELTIAVRYEEDCSRYGRVLLDDRNNVRGFEEKRAGTSGWMNGGCYLLSPALFANWRPAHRLSFEQDVLPTAVASHPPPQAYRSQRPFIDIGTPEDFRRAQTILARADAELQT